MTIYLGLDVHCKSTVYVSQNADGKVIGRGSIPTTAQGLKAMIDRLKAPKGTQVGLESGPQAFFVARVLFALQLEPVVIEAREVRVKARRKNQKSDFRDAYEICDGLRRGIYVSIVYVPDPRIQPLRDILSRRSHFIKLCTSQVNAAKFLLRQAGFGGEVGALKTPSAWQYLLQEPRYAHLHELLAMHAQVWRAAQDQVLALEAMLDEACQPFADTLKRLETFPGVGRITAATFVAVLGRPDRFPTSAHLASYLGLTPSTYDSGERQRHGHITKRGSAQLRAMLNEASWHAARPTHPLHPYFARVCAKHGTKKAVTCIAHRLSRILFQMWRKQEDFDLNQLNVVHEPYQKTKTVYYRFKLSNQQAQAA